MKMNSVEDLVTQSIKKRSDNRSFESESVFGEGKLLIELKIARDDTGEEVKEQLMSKNSDKHSVCNLCNKTFTSGKALGGHMRIHTQKKNLIFKNKLKAHQSVKFKKQNPRAEEDRRETDSVKKNECEEKKSPSADNCAGAAERRNCPVCQRVFPSKKSLFGHMRKHSDRKWRGICPPSIEKTNSGSIEKTNSGSCLSCDAENNKKADQDELLSGSGKKGGVDLTAYSSGWTSTARRGRKHLSLERDDFQLKELEAAAGLMVLKGLDFSVFVHRHGDELEYCVTSKFEVGEPSSLGAGRDRLDEKNLIKNKKKRKKFKLSDLQLSQNANLKSEKPENHASQIEEAKENGLARSRSLKDIDLNKMPQSEFGVEAPLMLGRRGLKLL